ncbi:alpha/beta fold hydrolase [Natrinema halophilum]|uniref:alpha/beta fold hydrolase n=1 Tax=Natrinema halophilum TaxID=1699371 RepID=UPI001F1A2F69|nr:alpha/beta hydrolase [Natrinema halophilum]UHQ96030.1 alpha/beta hydrolase [Natrinema halophilum]
MGPNDRSPSAVGVDECAILSTIDASSTVRTANGVRLHVALVESDGRNTAHVVGHDWGGMVAWDLALQFLGVVKRLSSVNAPNPTAYQRYLFADPDQLRRSWYAILFRLPWLPEWRCGMTTTAFSSELRAPSAPGTLSDDELGRCRRHGPGGMRSPKCSTGAGRQRGDHRIRQPTALPRRC